MDSITFRLCLECKDSIYLAEVQKCKFDFKPTGLWGMGIENRLGNLGNGSLNKENNKYNKYNLLIVK